MKYFDCNQAQGNFKPTKSLRYGGAMKYLLTGIIVYVIYSFPYYIKDLVTVIMI